jgi:hypothetical protein
MGVRQKLNQAYVNGTFVIAAGVGLITQSWAVFWLAAIVFVVGSLHSGDIRLGGRRRR